MTSHRQGAVDWRKALMTSSATLQDAIRNLNDSACQIVLVVESTGHLLGTITDGDIRRGMLRGVGLDQPVASVMNKTPLVVPPELGRDAVLQLMQLNGVHQLPVVNEHRLVVDLYLLEELIAPERRDNLMVIMAGGQGMRLRPHTENCPKPLLPVGGKPMLEHIIYRARAEGFYQFVISIFYLGHMIEDYFGDGSRWDVKIDYLRETSPLGTAGSLGLMAAKPTTSFVVTNGDVLTDIRYSEILDFHQRYGASGTMAVKVHEWQHPFGVVRTRGVEIIGFEEKPVMRSHVNAGVYVLEPAVLDLLSPGEPCDMPSLFDRLRQQSLQAIVYPMHEPWLDVGRHEDLQRVREAHAEEN